MKKIILLSLTLISIIAAPLLISSQAGAAFDPFPSCNGSATDDSSVCNEKNNQSNPLTGNEGLLVRAARLLSQIIGIVSVIIVIYGGIKYITSNGVAANVNSAKETILYALIGIVVSLLAQGIIIFIVNNVN